MKITETEIAGTWILEPKVYGDDRGYFFESFSRQIFEETIGKITFVQENESRSSFGVVRGLHYQRPPFSQAKLLRVVQGCVWDIAVDLRKDAATFGHYIAVELSGENKRQFFIPRGFAHGFAVLSEMAIFQYKCDNYYAPEYEGGIRFDDPKLGIDWKVPREKMVLSEKDLKHEGLDKAFVFDFK